jgi:hypothetical protein
VITDQNPIITPVTNKKPIVTPPADEKPIVTPPPDFHMNFKKAEVVFALVIVVAFFLPWVNIGGIISVSGFDAIRAVNNLAEMADALNGLGGNSSTMPDVSAIYGLYLIPISAVGVVVADMRGANTKALSLIAGALPILALLYALSKMGGDMFEGMGIGAYLTVGGGIGLLAAGLGLIRFQAVASTSPEA